MGEPRPLTPSSRPSLFLQDQPLLWRLAGTCTQVRGKEAEGRVQLGRVTPRGGEREALFLLAASPSSPAALPPLWVCCLRGLLKNSPRAMALWWAFRKHAVYSCSALTPRAPFPYLLPRCPGHHVPILVFPSPCPSGKTTSHSPQGNADPYLGLPLSPAEWTARGMLGPPPQGRTLLEHPFRSTVLTRLSCARSLRVGAHVSCRTTCKRI